MVNFLEERHGFQSLPGVSVVQAANVPHRRQQGFVGGLLPVSAVRARVEHREGRGDVPDARHGAARGIIVQPSALTT